MKLVTLLWLYARSKRAFLSHGKEKQRTYSLMAYSITLKSKIRVKEQNKYIASLFRDSKYFREYRKKNTFSAYIFCQVLFNFRIFCLQIFCRLVGYFCLRIFCKNIGYFFPNFLSVIYFFFGCIIAKFFSRIFRLKSAGIKTF